MGDAYRGLTIKIGADTEKLQSALKNVKSAARATQSDLRAVSRAAKLDPSNVSLAQSKFKLLSEQANNTATQMATVQKTMRQLGAQKVSGKSIKELAESGRNVRTEYQKARTEIQAVNRQLESVYNAVAKNRSGKSSGKEFNKELAEIRQLSASWNDATGKSEEYLEFTKRIRAAMRKMSDGENPLGISTGNNLKNANLTIEAVKRLKQSWHELSDERDRLGNVDTFNKLRTESMLFESQLRSNVNQMIEARREAMRIGETTGQQKASAQYERLSQAAREAAQEERLANEALSLDPTNIQAAEAAVRAMKNQEEIAAAEAEQLSNKLKEFSPEIVHAAATMDGLKLEMANASGKSSELHVKIEKAKGALSEAEKEAKDLAAKFGESSEEAGKAATKVNRIADAVERLETKSSDADAKLEKLMRIDSARNTLNELSLVESKMRSVTESSGRSWERVGDKMTTVGYAMYSTITPAIMTAFRYGIQGANDIDSAYRDMRKTVDGTEEDFGRLKKSAEDFSRTHVTSADQMLEIQALGGQLGIGVDKLDKFAEAISNITVATTITDAEDAAERVGQLANVMTDMREGLANGQDTYAQFSDSLVRLGNNSATTEDKIMDVSARLMAAANIYGMSTPQLLAWSTAISSTGQNSEAAGTAMSNSMAAIEKAVSAGEDSLQAFADVAGKSADEFAATWSSDPSQALYEFIEGLKRVDENGGSMDATLAELGITAVRQRQGLEGLTQTIDDIPGYMEMATNAWNDGGDAAEEANKKAEGFSGQLAILQNNAQLLGEAMGEGLMPYMKDASSLMEGMTSAIADMNPEMKTAIVGFGAFLAGSAPLSIFLGGALRGFYALNSSIGTTSQALKVFARGNKELVAAEITAALNSESKAVQVYGQKLKAISTIARLAKFAAAGVAIGATAVLVKTAIDRYQEYAKRQEDVAKATKSLSEVIEDSGKSHVTAAEMAERDGKATESWGQVVTRVSQDVRKTTEDTAKVLEDNANLAEEREKKVRDTFANTALIEKYAGTIEELMDTEGLTMEQQARLKGAVDGYNEATGSAIEITDAANGKLRDSRTEADLTKDSFKELADAKIAAQKADMWGELYGEDYKQQISNQKQQLDNMKKLNEAQAKLKEFEEANPDWKTRGANGRNHGITDLTMEHARLVDQVKQEQKNVDDLNGTMKELNNTMSYEEQLMTLLTMAENDGANTIADVVAASNDFQMAMMASDKSILDITQKMTEAGVSADDFKRALEEHPDMAEQLAEAYDGSFNSIIDVLAAFGIEVGHVSDDTQTLTKKMRKLDGTEVDIKVDDGGTVYDAEGAITGLHERAVEIDGKTYTFYLDDQGTVRATSDNIHEIAQFDIGDKHFIITDDGTIIDEQNNVTTLQELGIDDKKFDVTDGGSVDRVKNRLESINTYTLYNKSVSISARGIDTVIDKVTSLDYKLRHLPNGTNIDLGPLASRLGSGQASGGFIGNGYSAFHAMGGIIGGLPVAYHADGYIADRATLANYTNGIANIVGEAGAEAVIPLTNRRYVRPFAQAVAAEIPVSEGVSVSATFIVNDARDPELFARKAMREISRIARAEGKK